MSDGSAYANPSVSAGGDVGDVTKHALEILARAQAHADTVKAQADEVFSAAQTRARELTAEAERLQREASALHAAAVSDRDQAAAVLASAHDLSLIHI